MALVTSLMFGSCHFVRASNDEFSVECLFWFFQPTWKSNLKVIQITKNDLFWVNAPLWYLKWALNCKNQTHLKNITISNIWHSSPCPNDINQTLVCTSIHKIVFWLTCWKLVCVCIFPLIYNVVLLIYILSWKWSWKLWKKKSIKFRCLFYFWE